MMNMKISSIRIAVAMAAGIYSASVFGFNYVIILTATITVAFVIYSVIRRKVYMSVALLILAFIIAVASYAFAVSAYAHKSLGYINRFVTLEGVTLTSPRKSSYDENYTYTFRVKKITDSRNSINVADDILLTSPQNFKCGSSLEVKGIITKFPDEMNEDGFDLAEHYKSQNIFTRIHTLDISETEPIPIFSVRILGEKLSEHIQEAIYKHFKGEGAAVLTAIFTGNKNNFSPLYYEKVSKTAFSRIFHPGYIHIYIILFLLGLFNTITPKRFRDIVAIVIFAGYALLQCTHVGFARCMMCASLMLLFRMIYGRSFFPNNIAVIVIFCAAVVPTMFFNAAFIMSLAGGLLMWSFAGNIARKMKRLPKLLRRPLSVIAVSAVFYTPLSLYFYNSICIYGIITPMLTAPIIICILILTVPVLLMYELFGCAPIIGAYLNLMLKILVKLPYLIDKMPLSGINTGTLSFVGLLEFLCFIFICYYSMRKRFVRTKIFVLILSGLCLSSLVFSLSKIGTAEFVFVNVGQGDGAVINTYCKETIIIDGGGSRWNSYNPGKALFVPYLESKGYNRIEAGIVTHYHSDHAMGVIEAIKEIKTDIVFAPPTRPTDSDEMKLCAEELKSAAEENGTKIYYVTEDIRIKYKDGLIIDIFAPNDRVAQMSENNTSLMVKVQYGEFSALYTGDSDMTAERLFVTRANVDADILKVAHHGSRTSTSKEFVSAVSPEYAIISCGENNIYDHPNTETLMRLSETKVFTTATNGDIRIYARKNGKFSFK